MIRKIQIVVGNCLMIAGAVLAGIHFGPGAVVAVSIFFALAVTFVASMLTRYWGLAVVVVIAVFALSTLQATIFMLAWPWGLCVFLASAGGGFAGLGIVGRNAKGFTYF